MLRVAPRSLFQATRTRSLATAASNNVVNIVEVGPRDGLQNEKGSVIPVDLKVELINRLVRAGVTNVEAGSFVSPKWVPQVRVLVTTNALPPSTHLWKLDGRHCSGPPTKDPRP